MGQPSVNNIYTFKVEINHTFIINLKSNILMPNTAKPQLNGLFMITTRASIIDNKSQLQLDRAVPLDKMTNRCAKPLVFIPKHYLW